MMDSIPIVALTGQVPAALIGKDAFQEADTIGISLPCTKQSFAVRAAADIPRIIDRAFRTAISGRPGPVLIDLPKSVLLEMAEPSYPATLGVTEPERKREFVDAEIERAADMINGTAAGWCSMSVAGWLPPTPGGNFASWRS